ncbi:MAG TPA: malto-oligosyltrehalose trehalohydrolase [Vicinamibacterales bacterium]|nr:malto-oligosyltrehalose trehalohydrolase [Vicinamibacterales bacterium]
MSVGDLGRRLPVGAEVVRGGGVHFRVWAPDHAAVTLVVAGDGRGGSEAAGGIPMKREAHGYFAVMVPDAHAGTLYRYRLPGHEGLLKDPASRSQPEGPHGPSRVVDPSAFAWSDTGWAGVGLEGQVIYELHVGTFTPEGTWASAAAQLAELRDLGVTVIEMMPVADFPGRFGWGYDGVDLFAPTRLYGIPDDLRRFVDRAHALGLAVILDVVYNHLGPDGASQKAFAAEYFTNRYPNEWGDAINFDGPGSGPVREFYLANAAHWIDEYHFDGLRLDATQVMCDKSPRHILSEISERVRAAAGSRSVLLVAENEPQVTRLVRPTGEDGYGLDALWNDDYHHSALVALTGRNEAYYTDHLGAPQEFISAAKHGYLYQGQRYAWQDKGRGTPAWGLPPAAFVAFLENHDQVANSGRGRRAHQLGSPGRLRALTALTLLGPGTPMLFQGQEFGSSRPFLFFADHRAGLAGRVRKGRREFLAQFPSLAGEQVQRNLADPSDPETFERCRLDFSDRDRHAGLYAMHRDLLALRRTDPAFRAQRRGGADGAVLGPHAFVLRFLAPDGHDGDRLLLVNLGRDLTLRVAPEPLLAPPAGLRWEILWSSEDPRYDGGGTAPLLNAGRLHMPGEAAVVLAAGPPED